MAFRIEDSVLRGEIDNRTKGTVTGKIWVMNRDEPVILQLQGNAHPDLAGCLLTFENPKPGPVHPEIASLHPEQTGTIGDLTASRKCRVYDIPVDQAYEMSKRGEKPPEHLANVLYLEWFSEKNGRVVIEGPDWKLKLTAPEWTPTPEDEERRAQDAAEGLTHFFQRLTDAVDKARHQGPEEIDDWDEFDYEKLMKESDARTDKYSELLDKYGHGEEAEKIIAREMGWTWLEEALEKKDTNDDTQEWVDAEDAFDFDNIEDPVPDPATEGIDWVRNHHDDIVHPLAHRSYQCSLRLIPFKDQEENAELQHFIFSVHMISAKLAGALNSLWMDHDISDHAFTVATLKRALQRVHESQHAFQPIKEKSMLPQEELVFWEQELAGIRDEILRLMEKYRGRKTD